MKKVFFLLFLLASEAQAQATCKMIYVCQNMSQNCQYVTVCE